MPASANALENVFSVLTWLAVSEVANISSNIVFRFVAVSAFLLFSNLVATCFSSILFNVSLFVFNCFIAASSSLANISLSCAFSSASIKPFSCASSSSSIISRCTGMSSFTSAFGLAASSFRFCSKLFISAAALLNPSCISVSVPIGLPSLSLFGRYLSTMAFISVSVTNFSGSTTFGSPSMSLTGSPNSSPCI